MEYSLYRLSTPTHKYFLPFSVDFISDIRLTYKQGDTIVAEKSGNEIVYSGQKEFSVNFTQEETRRFSAEDVVRIQAVIVTKNGKVIPSKEIVKVVNDVLNDEVIKV